MTLRPRRVGEVQDLSADHLRHLLTHQEGVIARRQALKAGLAAHDIRRMLRRREWATVHPGVYVDHTGPLTWPQRAWAAVLSCEPAALCRESARRAVDGPGREGDERWIDVAVDRHHHRHPPPGVRLHRTEGLHDRVLWNASPPRTRPEETALDLACAASRDVDAVAHLAAAVGSRQTTAARLADALDRRGRVKRRTFISGVLEDVASGSCSTLEHGFVDRVERPHGLPISRRQWRESLKGPLYRDAYYEGLGMIVELDGRVVHGSQRARDSDLERDLDALLTGRHTARLGWAQVFDRPCQTAVKLGTALNQRGWTGQVVTCPRCAGP